MNWNFGPQYYGGTIKEGTVMNTNHGLFTGNFVMLILPFTNFGKKKLAGRKSYVY
jgi:hypothetical protein